MNHQETSDTNGKSRPAIEADTQSDVRFDRPDDGKASEPERKSRRSKRWRGVSSLVIILLLLSGGFAFSWWQSNNARNSAPAGAMKPRGVPVKIAPVETSTLEDSSEFVGTLEARRSVQLRAEIDGQVRQIYVKSGDYVRQGAVVARLESEELRSQLTQAKASVVRAEARLEELLSGSRPEEIAGAKARLAEAQARLAEARAGTRREEIAQATARVEAAKSQAILASQQANRYRRLSREGAISQDLLEQYLEKESSSRSALQEAERLLEQRQNGTRTEEIARLEAAVEQERQALIQLQNGSRPEEIAQQKAQVAEAVAQVRTQEARLENSGIVAPFAGMIGDIPVKLGEYLRKGDTLTTITQNQSLDLRLLIPLERSAQLKLGLPVQLTSPTGETLGRGTIGFISPQVSPDSQAILAKATFDNSRGQLRDGQFVRAKTVWNARTNAIVIPTTAIIFQGQERFVYITQPMPQSPPAINPENQGKLTPEKVQSEISPTPSLAAKRQPIQLGLVKGDKAEVIQGLQPGTEIIISGTQKLADGVPIIPLPDR